MRTVLNGTTAGRRAAQLALVAGLVGALALPASAVQAQSAEGSRHAGPRTARSGGVDVGDRNGTAVLGPAAKYVRRADGTIRRVR